MQNPGSNDGKDHDDGFRRDAPADDAAMRLLRERAAELARPPAPEDAEAVLDVLEFRVGGARYAFATQHVREVVKVDRSTPLPGAGAFVRGLANVRGEILSVLDLGALLEAPSAPPQGAGHVIVLVGGDMVFGVEAETILGVSQIARGRIADRRAGSRAGRSRYIRGLTRDGLAFIDAAELLGDATVVVNQEAPAVRRGAAPARPGNGGPA